MNRRWVDLGILVGLVALAFALRWHDYDRVPYPNETADEYAFLWAGWSLLHDGVPTGWSWKDAYADGEKVFANGTLYRLVTPWLDHPPLYALLTGVVGSLSSAREMLDVPLRAGRALSVALGAASAGLLFLLARERYGRLAAGFAGLFFAVVPTVVLANRLVVAEALTTPLTLLALWAAGRGWTWLALGAAFLAPLAKVPGVSVGLALATVAPDNRRRAAAVAAAVLGLAPYVLYGLVVAPRLFLDLMADQSGKSSGIEVLPYLLTGASVGPVSWRDAWIPVLWAAVGYAAFRRDRLVAALIVPYLVVMVAVVDQSVPRVWYREPLFPGLCLAGGLLARDMLRRPRAIGVALVVFSLAFGKLAEGPNVWQLIGPLGQRAFPVVVLGLAVPMLAGWRRAMRWEVAIGLTLAVGASVFQVWNARGGTYPDYRPPPYEEVKVGAIQRYVLVQTDPIKVSAVWDGAAGRPSQLVLRSNGTIVARGTSAPAEGTKEYEVAAPGSGNYELAIESGAEALVLGTVRVRR